MPFARATGIGSTFDCADHSKSVCFFDSAIISSPLIVASISVAMCSSISAASVPSPQSLLASPCFQARFSFRAEFVARLPLRHLVGLRDAVADREQHHQILARAGEIPVRQDNVLRRVIALRVPLLALLLRVFRRLADV